MDSQIEWIKTIVNACMSIDSMPKEDIKHIFSLMEQQFEMYSELEKQKIIRIFESQFAKEDLVFVFSIMLEYMNMEYFSDALIEAIIASPYDAITKSQMVFQLVSIKNISYSSERKLREHVVQLIAKEAGLKYDYIPVENRDDKYVVAFIDQILSDKHSATKFGMRYLYTLQKYLGFKVELVVIPSDGNLPGNIWHSPIRANCIAEYKNKSFEYKYKDITIQGHQICSDNSDYYGMLNTVLDEVYSRKPLFSFNLATNNPVGDIANMFTTGVALKMQVGTPVSNANILLELDTEDNEKTRTLSVNDEMFLSDQKRIVLKTIKEYFEKPAYKISKSELGLSNDDYHICVVGNRLDSEVDDVFVNMLKRAYDTNPIIKYVIFGNVNDLCNKMKKVGLNDVTYYAGAVDNLSELYTAMDLYVNPVRIGGGFSSGMAIASGLPVITLGNCDVAYNVGSYFTVSNLEEMEDCIDRYINDASFREKADEVIEDINEKNSEEVFFKNMAERMKMIIENI